MGDGGDGNENGDEIVVKADEVDIAERVCMFWGGAQVVGCCFFLTAWGHGGRWLYVLFWGICRR